VDSPVIISGWQPVRWPGLFFMQPLPIVPSPAGPRTSGGAEGSSLT
jgi:hypothetical protein